MGGLEIHSAWSNGPVKAHVEHQPILATAPVLVVEGPKGRAAVSTDNEPQVHAVLSSAKEGN